MSVTKGYLSACMDKRFWLKVAQAFAEKTGMEMTDFWLETNAGGANTQNNPTGEDYAVAHGAQVFGWGAHGSVCGGQPGVSDDDSKAILLEKIQEKKLKFPGNKHYGIFLTEEKVEIWEA
ncbi:hypothetical protein COW38_01520 [Candidatus Collierbacteria bacterium CG17_big_fil_post_rev_8_21_14_2_50_45_7]|uniref:Uncharacterized protein n=2 Tax=Candidatus Collieribacteriota TaxID=1752725 RepID=A0A2M7FQ19_9BACT|nr:MAG: hypothetical protein COW38_01520 [Candidatus Collierbacteria bacterium CG17_big_fil_post_rev_8_21_14_2_50_45_7]